MVDIGMASLIAQLVKNPPAMQDTWVQSPGWENLLEKVMATHYSILAFRFPRTEEPGELHSMKSHSPYPPPTWSSPGTLGGLTWHGS